MCKESKALWEQNVSLTTDTLIKKSENLASTPGLKCVSSPRHHFLMLCIRHVYAVPELQVSKIQVFLGVSCINDFVVSEDINESDIYVPIFQYKSQSLLAKNTQKALP